ncbi:histidine kinase dimerization/phospho-acceptor domain-containing protein [Hydrogenophaga sp. UC242_53]|uniref:histidine kinase dimerization/phospho-acceptor domain-containing protein n=1 Tax=Hydrogenophaga sp. UC242_53 TaxID=3350170 RepID=UPI0036D2C346
MGRSYEALLSSDNAGEDEVDPGQVLRLAKAHGQWETRGWRLREDGSRFWAHTVLTALRNEAGELQGLSSITRDMTAAKSLEDVMNDLNRELEKRVAERTQQLVAANKDLDVFSHMVSHDLRAPLRHIASFVSLLQEQMGDSADTLALQYQNSIAKASKRMSLMIEGLLEYARLGRVGHRHPAGADRPARGRRDRAPEAGKPGPAHRVGDRERPARRAGRCHAARPGPGQPAGQLREIHPSP